MSEGVRFLLTYLPACLRSVLICANLCNLRIHITFTISFSIPNSAFRLPTSAFPSLFKSAQICVICGCKSCPMISRQKIFNH